MKQNIKDLFSLLTVLGIVIVPTMSLLLTADYFQSSNIEGNVVSIQINDSGWTIYLSQPSFLNTMYVTCPNFISTIRPGITIHIIQYHAKPFNSTCIYEII